MPDYDDSQPQPWTPPSAPEPAGVDPFTWYHDPNGTYRDDYWPSDNIGPSNNIAPQPFDDPWSRNY